MLCGVVVPLLHGGRECHGSMVAKGKGLANDVPERGCVGREDVMGVRGIGRVEGGGQDIEGLCGVDVLKIENFHSNRTNNDIERLHFAF